MEKNNRILNRNWYIVSYRYRSTDSFMVGGIRGEKLRDFLLENGHSATLVTYSSGIHEASHIHINDPLGKNKKKSRILGAISPIDSTIIWSFKVNNYLKKQEPSIVLTTIPPFGVSLVGLLLKLRKKKHFWIIDFRDPWTLNVLYRPVFYCYKKIIARYLERLSLKYADLTILNTTTDLHEHIRKYPFIEGKAITIRNGFSQFKKNIFSKSGREDLLKLVYMGSAYPKGEAALALSDFIRKVNYGSSVSVQCDYYGEYHDNLKDSVNLFYKGQVPYEEVSSILCNYRMGLIYLPEESIDSGRVTQKFYDYIGSGVIPIIINPSKEMVILLDQLNTGIKIFPEDDLLINIEKIKKQYFSNFVLKEEILEEFTRKHQFEKLVSFLTNKS